MTTMLTVGFGCPTSGMVIDCEAGKMDSEVIALADGPVTVKAAVAVTKLPAGLPDAMAVMTVVPWANPLTITGVPVTTPCVAVHGPGAAQTVATAGLLEYQVTV